MKKVFDVLVVGAGPAGMYALHCLRGRGYSVKVIERGDSVGGVWYWNRYPGARCDVESVQYQFGFSNQIQHGWTWTERYAGQPEILAYLKYVADTLKLWPDIGFRAKVVSAIYDDNSRQWLLTTEQGEEFSAKYCVMATGCLSSAQVPNIAGLDKYRGQWHHTGDWPHEGIDFSNRRVGIIGTGSSGIQLIPIVARAAERLYVFQRTPNFTSPACNHSLDSKYVDEKKRSFVQDRKLAGRLPSGTLLPVPLRLLSEINPEEVMHELEKRWGTGNSAVVAFSDLLIDRRTNDTVAEFVREKIRRIIDDPSVAALMSPTDHPIGAKRPCLDTGYFETFNQPNVKVIDLRGSPIERFTQLGLIAGGREYAFDTMVFATGYDAMTGALTRVDIRGSKGISLKEEWSAGPKTYLGLGIAGFPNLFLLAGPGGPSVLANMMLVIEQNVDWLADCLDYLKRNKFESIEPMVDAVDGWVLHLNQLASGTLMGEANSWYLGANIPGKPRVFMPYVGGLNKYIEKCSAVANAGYEGFDLRQ